MGSVHNVLPVRKSTKTREWHLICALPEWASKVATNGNGTFVHLLRNTCRTLHLDQVDIGRDNNKALIDEYSVALCWLMKQMRQDRQFPRRADFVTCQLSLRASLFMHRSIPDSLGVDAVG